MDWFNKSVTVSMRRLLLILSVLSNMSAGALGQRYHYPYQSPYSNPYHGRPQNVWGGHQQHHQPPPVHHTPQYHQRPSSQFSPVAMPGPASSAPYYSQPSSPPVHSQPNPYYPPRDHFYVHDRQRLPQSSSQSPIYSSPQLDAYYSSPSYYSHSSTNPPAGNSPVVNQPFRYPSETYHTPAASSYPAAPQYSPPVKYQSYPAGLATRPLPPAAGGPSTSNRETYREAMDLFAEVIRKLGKEARSVSGLKNAAKFFLSNGIYGGTSSLSPQYLDHVMGPEFLHRAKKLYGKIIQEQNERLARVTQASPYDNELPPSFGRDHGGGDYADNMIPAGSYDRPSYYSRNMVVGPSSAPVPMEAVKSVEVWSNGGGVHNHQTVSSVEEIMQTAESSAPKSAIFPGHQVGVPGTGNANHVFQSQPHHQATAAPPAITPLNDNDFIEHPLPYHEYEGFVRDIVQNHSYSK